jgi:hypothetical protein
MATKKEKKADEEILEVARKRFTESYDYDQDDRKEGIDDLKFAWNFDKHQWPDDIREKRENDPHSPRPCLVLNKIPEKIDVIEGEFRQAEPSVQVIPVDSQADPQIAEVLGGIIKHIEYDSTARPIYNGAYSYLLHSGRLAWRVNTKKNKLNPFEKELCLQPIQNPFSVYYDPYAIAPDRSDAKFCFVTEMIPKKEFEKKYPKAEEESFNADDDDFTKWQTGENVRIAEYWYKKFDEEKVYLVTRDAGQGEFVDVIVTEEQLRKDEAGEIIDTVKDETTQEKVTVWYCKMTANYIIEQPKQWPGQYIPIIFGMGKSLNIDGKNRSRGMVRHAKDPMRMYNYFASTETERFALSPKAPYILTSGMLGPHKGMWDTLGTKNWPYLIAEVDPKMPGVMPKREVPALASSGIINELARLEHDIMSAMGIYGASLGDQGDEKSGKAITARQRQGNIGAYSYIDTMALCLTYSAKILIDLIPYVYDTERIQRIRGEDDSEKKVALNARPEIGESLPEDIDKELLVQPKQGISEYINDVTVGKYDVRVKIGPSYTTQREESVAKLIDLLSKAPQLIPLTIDLVAKNIDAPFSQELMKRIEKAFPDLKDDGNKEEQQIDPMQIVQQVQQQMMQMKEFKELELAEREQTRKEFDSQIKAMKDLAEAEAKERGQQLAELKLIVDDIRASYQPPEVLPA